MNLETIIVASIAGLGPAVIGLIPLYLKLREERRQAAAKSSSDMTDATRRATDEVIRRLTERNEELEKDKAELEQKLDEERDRRRATEDTLKQKVVDERDLRRKAEFELSEANIVIEKQRRKIERLEKKDTGELKKE